MPANDYWAAKILQTWDSDYRPRWEVFDAFVRSLQDNKKICLEIGSGSSGSLETSYNFKLKIQSDLITPAPGCSGEIPFIQMNVYDLPIKNTCIDLILLRFVLEHLVKPETAFQEIKRILKPGGIVIILTTNLISPFIFLPKILPHSIREKLFHWLFNVPLTDVFPTYHRLNRKGKIKELSPDFQIQNWIYLQDANWQRRWWFTATFLWHLLTRWLHAEFLRSNFLAILRKI
jgi:SAM-dependent methyltransferase